MKMIFTSQWRLSSFEPVTQIAFHSNFFDGPLSSWNANNWSVQSQYKPSHHYYPYYCFVDLKEFECRRRRWQWRHHQQQNKKQSNMKSNKKGERSVEQSRCFTLGQRQRRPNKWIARPSSTNNWRDSIRNRELLALRNDDTPFKARQSYTQEITVLSFSNVVRMAFLLFAQNSLTNRRHPHCVYRNSRVTNVAPKTIAEDTVK